MLSLKEGLIVYKEVKIIRIKSKRYQLTIMKDYLPIIGEIEGDIQIGVNQEVVEFKNIIAYYMHKHNSFKLFIKEKEEKNEHSI